MSNPLAAACAQAVALDLVTWPELHDMYSELDAQVGAAFDAAVLEPKLTNREDMIARNSAPMAPTPAAVAPVETPTDDETTATKKKKKKKKKPEVMRKLMTRVVAETLETKPASVYVGEDVRHGGYYLVTEGLAKKCVGS